MARRRQKMQPYHLLLGIAFLFLAYIVPFVIFLGWLIAEFRAQRALSNSADDPSHLLEEIAQAQTHIEAMWNDGRACGLDLRQDNMFDARSTEGRELNAAIYTEQAVLEDFQERLERVLVPLAQRAAMRGAAVAWMGVFVFVWVRQPDGDYRWMSVWASVAAIIVAAGTYFVRKAAYENSAAAPPDIA